MSSKLVLKRLRQSELGWFKACRELGRETGRQRGLNFDADLVRQLFGLGRETPEVSLLTTWHDGVSIVQDVRPLKLQQKNWRLVGNAVTGHRFGRATAVDIVFMEFNGRFPDYGAAVAEVRWDVISQADSSTWSLYNLADRVLGTESSVLLDDDNARLLHALASSRLLSFGGGSPLDTSGLPDEDWERAIGWLLIHLSKDDLNTLLSTGAEASTAQVLEALGSFAEPTSARSTAESIVRFFGSDLLANKQRRDFLIGKSNSALPSPQVWTRGSASALRFARNLGLPEVFAGIPTEVSPAHEDVEAWGRLNELHPYQKDISSGISQILQAGTWEKRRAIVWLPTGTGKTRATVETLLMECVLEPPRNCLLWIADREELCEQAVETFRHVWMLRGQTSRAVRNHVVPSLRVIRLWGNRDWQEPPLWPTVIVASIQTLAERLKGEAFQEELAILADRAAAIVFDEAHHVVAPSYSRVMEALGLSRNGNYFGKNRTSAPPLIGLTATPARASGDETERLSKKFLGRLIEPGEPYRTLRGYQDGGYLAQLDVAAVPTGWNTHLDNAEVAQLALWQRLPSSVVRRAGTDERRTARIVRDLEARLSDRKAVLVFACSVAHARTIAEVLCRRGVRAAAVDGNTPRSIRWQVIQRFREGGLQVLVNCDLLATGFDAPNVDTVAIARPVGSRVLWTQMVGRGLRGPLNGGTERCLLLDYQDNIDGIGDLELLRTTFRHEYLSALQDPADG